MEYQTIVTIKKTEKSMVELAATELFSGPVIVKHLKGGNPKIYRLLSVQRNDHIPQIYAIEEQEKELLVVEEYIDGESLREHLQRGVLSDEEKIEYALQLCEAVGFLHTMKPSVIHRDIKPSNILITGKGVLKLIDFDASRQYKETSDSSDTRLLGTQEYAPPEQFGYSQTDTRSDIYSMGIVFHEMRPTQNKKLAAQWKKITEKCTNFDPKNRYQSVEELKRELKKLEEWKKKRTKKSGVLFGIGFFLGALLVFFLFEWKMWNMEKQVSMTPVPTPSEIPVPTPSETPVPTPSETPAPTPSETLVPTPSETPVSTPSETPVPTSKSEKELVLSSEIPENLWKRLQYIEVSADQKVNPVYRYYQGYPETMELIFNNEVSELRANVIGGACFKHGSGEWFYIPPEMTYGGPTYYGVADEFLQLLEPGDYKFFLQRKTEDGSDSLMGRSARIYSAEEIPLEADQLFVNTEVNIYSDYPRDNERKFVLVRIPKPELNYCEIDDNSVKPLFFKNDIMDDSYSEGEQLANKQLQEGSDQIKKSIGSNATYYQMAKKLAKQMITSLVKGLNGNIEGLTVEVEFID